MRNCSGIVPCLHENVVRKASFIVSIVSIDIQDSTELDKYAYGTIRKLPYLKLNKLAVFLLASSKRNRHVQ